MSNDVKSDSLGEIAVIGMAGQFPKAKNLEEFWRNLRNGLEAVSFFPEDVLRANGLDDEIIKAPNFVPAAGVLDGMDLFDASFFGFSPREAEAMDPQHRLLLECAWAAMENAGCNPENGHGPVGVYCGTSMSSYMFLNLCSNRQVVESIGGFQLALSNDKDYSATNISFKMNLTGPSVNVNSACSTSLVAISLGCQGLLNYDCDMALAGGASIGLLRKVGYMYQPGAIESPDGHCRAFDAQAGGTVHGDGVGMVVLKRLEDAIEAGDFIHAVIKGAAVNNDGSEKIGYTAPGVDGQAEVVAMSQSLAGADPESIDYIETHGTGTELGDPIEVAALTKAFRTQTEKKGFCALGSVKTNIGHLFAAAGVAGFIKTVLALEHEEIPPTLHFKKPNPKIDFENSPFFVNTRLAPWPRTNRPRRAGVSAFGIGGTNAHVILEEAPLRPDSGSSRPEQLLLLSARTSNALDRMTENLANHLAEHPDVKLADVAYTLQTGRKSFRHRRAFVCQTAEDAQALLLHPEPKRVVNASCAAENRPVVFMFPGQGAQYANMSKGLYENEAEFRKTVDACCEILKSQLDLDLLEALFPSENESIDAANERLKQTEVTQPALFVVEYSLAKLWMAWGVAPQAMIGHSIGEYVAACLAGVFSLEAALALVVERGRLMQRLPGGSMLAVSSPESHIAPMLEGALSVAAVNAPSLCVVSGPTPEIDAFEKRLAEKGMEGRRLHTSHAFHSSMMDDILESFEAVVEKVERSAPSIPYVSNVSGTWITEEQIRDPKYWSRHLRNAVRFSDGVQALAEEPSRVFLEIGPGRTLSTLTSMTLMDVKMAQKKKAPDQVTVSSMRHPDDKQPDLRHLLVSLGKLWAAGVAINWTDFYQNEKRLRLPLPTYHFERQRYWIEPDMAWLSGESAGPATMRSLKRNKDIADWFYVPSWKRTAASVLLPDTNGGSEQLTWLVFVDDRGVAERLVARLRKANQHVFAVRPGTEFSMTEEMFEIDPGNVEHYDLMLKKLRETGSAPQRILHLWSVSPASEETAARPDNIDAVLTKGFYSLLHLAKAIGNNILEDVRLVNVVNGALNVIGEDLHAPEKATVLGPGRVIDIEYANVVCCALDVDLRHQDVDDVVAQIISEAHPVSKDRIVAYRRGQRWVQEWEPVKLPELPEPPGRLREGGVYLITGGLGGIGLVFARYLAKTAHAKLVLTGRSALPPREEWEKWAGAKGKDKKMAAKIQKVLELEAAGAEVLVASADVSDFDGMRTVVEEAKARFGAINGIIHAAGLPGTTIAQLLTPEKAAEVLNPKVKGTLVLRSLCQGPDLDIFVLCSSIASVFGFAGQFDYGGANDFLDAFANYENPRSQTYTVAINWDSWADVGMSLVDDMTEERKRDMEVAIWSEEGVDALRRILNTDLNQVVVNTRNLKEHLTLVRQGQDNRLEDGAARPDGESEANTKYTRPNISADYVAPTDDIEKALAEVWQETFGIEQIGINDDFYELGGHSLLSARLMARVRDRFNIDMSLQTFFEKPTISELAIAVLEKLVEKEDGDTVSDILAEIEEKA